MLAGSIACGREGTQWLGANPRWHRVPAALRPLCSPTNEDATRASDADGTRVAVPPRFARSSKRGGRNDDDARHDAARGGIDDRIDRRGTGWDRVADHDRRVLGR